MIVLSELTSSVKSVSYLRETKGRNQFHLITFIDLVNDTLCKNKGHYKLSHSDHSEEHFKTRLKNFRLYLSKLFVPNL